MSNICNRQRGAVLLVVLVMLVILTLFAIASINSSNLNLKIVGNVQAEKVMEGAAQEAIEQVLSSSANFTIPVPNPGTINVNGGSSYVNGAAVTVATPVCIMNTLAPGYDLNNPLAPEDDVWEVQANVTDNTTGASAVVHQGVKTRELAGNCP